MSISRFKPLIIAIVATVLCIILISIFMLPPKTVPQEKALSIGLIETDAEDSWRREMMEQIKQAAAAHKINLVTIETDRTQSSQINAIRSFIVYDVDAIVFSPVVNNSWDYVLEEAQAAGIPVITVNEELNTETAERIARVTYDYKSMGRKLTDMLIETARRKGITGEDLKILELKGTIGSIVSEHISEGVRAALEESGEYKINYSANADYMRSRAKELVNGLIRNGYEMDIIIAHNDGMALGALDALKKNGMAAGEDVQVVTFGGGRDAQELYDAGELSGMALCDLSGLGEKVVEIVTSFRKGEQVSDITYLNGDVAG